MVPSVSGDTPSGRLESAIIPGYVSCLHTENLSNLCSVSCPLMPALLSHPIADALRVHRGALPKLRHILSVSTEAPCHTQNKVQLYKVPIRGVGDRLITGVLQGVWQYCCMTGERFIYVVQCTG